MKSKKSNSVRERRASFWEDYQRAEKDAQLEEIISISEFLYALSLFVMGIAFYSLDALWSVLMIFSTIIWRKNFHDALKLRGGYSLTPRNEGDRRSVA